MNTHVIFKAFSNSLLARTLKSGMLATIMLSQTFPNLLAFKINMCTNSYLSGLPNLQGRRRLLKSGPAMKYQRHLTSAEGTSWGRAREGVLPLS